MSVTDSHVYWCSSIIILDVITEHFLPRQIARSVLSFCNFLVQLFVIHYLVLRSTASSFNSHWQSLIHPLLHLNLVLLLFHHLLHCSIIPGHYWVLLVSSQRGVLSCSLALSFFYFGIRTDSAELSLLDGLLHDHAILLGELLLIFGHYFLLLSLCRLLGQNL